MPAPSAARSCRNTIAHGASPVSCPALVASSTSGASPAAAPDARSVSVRSASAARNVRAEAGRTAGSQPCQGRHASPCAGIGRDRSTPILARPVASPVRTAVVIPCFNDGGFVGEAVASLRDEEPHELVIVDDGSTDEATIERLRELESEGIRIVRQANGGLAAARMAGVHATAAPYIYPLDADDVLAPGALARLADAMDANPQAAVAYGDVEMFGAASNFFDNSTTQLDPWLITYISNIPGTSMVRRTALLEAGGWQLNEGGYEDWDLWMAMAERGFRGVYAPGMQFRYRISADGRMWSDAMSKHDRLHALVRSRHPALFEGRRANRRRSVARSREKVLFPLIDAAPGLDLGTRQRLIDLVHDPGHIIKPRLRAIANRLRGK